MVNDWLFAVFTICDIAIMVNFLSNQNVGDICIVWPLRRDIAMFLQKRL